MFADAHLHMTDPLPDDAKYLFINASEPLEFGDLALVANTDVRVIPFFGTHPWYVDKYDADALESILRNSPSANVGEIGLDSKRGTLEEQIPVFEEQLSLAERYGRIASVHMVGTENDVLRILRKMDVRTILHSFSGPATYIRSFTECGCYFSISPRLLSKSSEKVKDIICSIPEDRLLLETDAPSFTSDIRDVPSLAERIAPIVGRNSSELLELTLENAERILRV